MVRVAGKTFSGRGASTDVVNAATRAYLHALDKAEQAAALETMAQEGGSLEWVDEMGDGWPRVSKSGSSHEQVDET